MASTPYLQGYPIKPASISGTGIVTFTDGRYSVEPNQQQCEAYGYTYNPITGTCNAFTFSTNLNTAINNETNIVSGQGNVTGVGTGNTHIIGQSNEVLEPTRNNLIVGSQNQITYNVDNTASFGTLGEVTATNSIVLGGNAGTDILGERQNITLIYGVQTPSDAPALANLNNTADSFFQPIENSVFYFQSEILAVRVGGSNRAGAVGDYKSWVERGVVKNASGTLSISRSQTAIVDSGTTSGWSTENTVSGSDFELSVTGARDMILEWIATIRITQIKTGVAL
jgi:hypothetical protein|tara:strand:- start:833 stop:1681 length:849 start_codon:yes stop_codon:yes gene_type:complete